MPRRALKTGPLQRVPFRVRNFSVRRKESSWSSLCCFPDTHRFRHKPRKIKSLGKSDLRCRIDSGAKLQSGRPWLLRSRGERGLARLEVGGAVPIHGMARMRALPLMACDARWHGLHPSLRTDLFGWAPGGSARIRRPCGATSCREGNAEAEAVHWSTVAAGSNARAYARNEAGHPCRDFPFGTLRVARSESRKAK